MYYIYIAHRGSSGDTVTALGGGTITFATRAARRHRSRETACTAPRLATTYCGFDLPPGCTQLHQSYISSRCTCVLWRMPCGGEKGDTCRTCAARALSCQQLRSLRLNSQVAECAARPSLLISSLCSVFPTVLYQLRSSTARGAGTAAYRYCRLPVLPPTWRQSPRCGCCYRAQLGRRRRRRFCRRQSRQTLCRSRRSSSSTLAHA